MDQPCPMVAPTGATKAAFLTHEHSLKTPIMREVKPHIHLSQMSRSKPTGPPPWDGGNLWTAVHRCLWLTGASQSSAHSSPAQGWVHHPPRNLTLVISPLSTGPTGTSSPSQPQNNQGEGTPGTGGSHSTGKVSLKEGPYQDFRVPTAIPCGQQPPGSASSPARPASWPGWAWYTCQSHNTPHAGAESLRRPGGKTPESESGQERAAQSRAPRDQRSYSAPDTADRL